MHVCMSYNGQKQTGSTTPGSDAGMCLFFYVFNDIAMYRPNARQRVAKHIRATTNTSVAMQSNNRGRRVFSVLHGPCRGNRVEFRSQELHKYRRVQEVSCQ
jgi:hypothetical protein